MNPIQITETLRESMIRYLLTTFDVNRDDQEPELRAALRNSFDTDGALFNGPYLELTLPYVTGNTLEDLVRDKILTPELLALECFKKGLPIWPNTPLYKHQERAIRRLSGEEGNIIVSSGTGSGKTECFLIPMLNDLLKDTSPGVRAVIIYPLNALVNDQLDRLRELLAGTTITFGRYTGELPQTEKEAQRNSDLEPLPNEVICRDQIQKEGKIPQILITNYAMLEYLLLRPADAPLFNSGAWRFIVLDEAHTHSGAQGNEVGLLIRRLRHRMKLAASDIRCVATSATLTVDDAHEAAAFGEALFGVPFDTDDVIFGEVRKDPYATESRSHPDPKIYLHQDFPLLIDTIRRRNRSTPEIARLLDEIGLAPDGVANRAEECEGRPEAYLWEVLKSNADLQTLREYMAQQGESVSVSRAARDLFADRLPAEDGEEALLHLIEVGAIARPDEENLPLLPARYHLFVRPPQGIWMCLNSECAGRESMEDAAWSRVFATRSERCDACGGALYPLYVCRTCGQSFMRGEILDSRVVSEADPRLGAEPVYFTWRPLLENPALADLGDDDLAVEMKDLGKFSSSEVVLCLRCQKPKSRCSCEDGGIERTLYRVDEIETSKKGVREVPVGHLGECPRCRDSAFGDTEIATPVSMFSTTPLSILTNELYRMLPESTEPKAVEKPGGGRKLLSFYDSRQGAARFAAFLQDAVNDQVYRHIIPEATRQLENERQRWPDLQEVIDRCYEIAWESRVFHNDPALSDELGRTRRPSRAQQDRLKLRLMEGSVAEFTTRRRYRQSLESLGLVAVKYFEAESLEPYKEIADRIGLDAKQMRDLIGYLLDGLRNQKVFDLPQGVHRDSEVFGRNRFSPRLVRSHAQEYEVSWVGATSRQHRRQVVSKVLQDSGLASSEDAQEEALNLMLTWLLEETDLLIGSPAEGYQLAHDRVFFTTGVSWHICDQCHRLSSYGEGNLPCPHPACTGHLHKTEVEAVLEDNYYRRIFDRNLIPMRVEEHTAQIDSKKGRQYQDEFRGGDINVLSCSTTFEMGIDLGDLQGIVLSNIPPTIANYRQRAGRAGRRTSGTAFILSWASDRPHDQTYFTSPPEIINGRVRVPHLSIENRLIFQRHVNAILFSAYLRHRYSAGYDTLLRVGPFFDRHMVDETHYDALATWLIHDGEEVRSMLQEFAGYANSEKTDPDMLVRQFSQDMASKGKEHYEAVTEYYGAEIQQAAQRIQTGDSSRLQTETIDRYNKLLNRIRDENIINYLSDRGVLPSYSFPLHTVELNIDPDKAKGLRLQRDVRQAIREYAPGQEIVADKRIWKSIGLVFYRETPQLFHYRICDNCNHLRVGIDAGIPIADHEGPCPICGEPPANHKRQIYQYVEPDGFRTSRDSGMPAGQYVAREANLTRSALIPTEPDAVELIGELVETGYSRQGRLLYVNEGKYGRGFKICLKCGLRVGLKKVKCPGTYKGEPCPGELQIVTLGFQEETDTLRLAFNSTPDVMVPPPEDRSFWLSLMYALIQGASHALQIERRDIDGVLFPRRVDDNEWQQSIVLFDDVPGGAGHVRQIRDEIIEVVREGLRIANCVDCAPDSSCYHCLRDFHNQYDHYILKRGPVAMFLEAVLSSLAATGDPTSPNPVVAINPTRWLMQTVGRAQDRVMIAADQVTLDSPAGETQNWPQLIQDLLRRDVRVTLALTSDLNLKTEDPAAMSLRRYLQVLLENGLDLRQMIGSPEWPIVIDPGLDSTSRCLKQRDGGLILNGETGEGGLLTVVKPSMVEEIERAFDETAYEGITNQDLELPPNVRVINVDPASEAVDELSLFGDVFDRPVRKMRVNDRYLYDYYRIVERLGNFINLASEGGVLERVDVNTWDAGKRQIAQATREEQNDAIVELKSRFPDIEIEFHRSHRVEHDRYILLERDDGTLARILIGRGLDFIRSDGTAQTTYIVMEDPYSP
jgi:hypothetical protein